MARVIAFLCLFLVSTPVFAGDYHQRGQRHAFTYTITTNSGDPVSGEQPRMSLKRVSDGKFLDFNDNTFKNPTTATTLFAPMGYDQTGGFYQRIITIDSTILVSGDYIITVSNDSSSDYSDVQAQGISIDTLGDLIRINR
jgi:hypothetical protein